MNQASNIMSSTKGEYRPVPWVFWVRIAQLGLTVLILALGAYAASQTWLASGITFSFWAIVWTIIYVPISVWGVTRVPGRYRPNIIVLVCECLSVFWWLIAFSLLATWSTSATFLGFKRMAKRDYYDDIINSAASASNSTYLEEYNKALGDLRAASACTKASTAFAAIVFCLFIATLVAISMQFHRQRKEFNQNRQQVHPMADGVNQQGTSYDKEMPQHHVQSV